MVKPLNSIEPKILPLVTAINNTKICHTFSSCEGHFSSRDKDFMDRSCADVRFDPEKDVPLEKIEHFLTFLITEFNHLNSFSPIKLYAYKLYTPDDNYYPDFVFVIILEPFDRLDLPGKKRRDIDKAILSAANIVDEYSRLF